MNPFSQDEFINAVCDQIHKKSAEVTGKSKLVEDLGIDSITLVNIISALSETYNVTFSDIDFEDVGTIEQIYKSLVKSIDEE